MPTFKRNERLKSVSQIQELFDSSKTIKISHYPYLVFWQADENRQDIYAKTLVSVSKKKFKSAVDRNRIKRQLRELYRLNKESLHNTLKSKGAFINLAIIFTGKEKYKFSYLDSRYKQLLQKLSTSISEA
jgi:ribonuclease P protein component